MDSWFKGRNYAGEYRLGDMILCNGGQNHSILDRYWCASLDPVNTHRSWPESIGDLYTRSAKKRRDVAALVHAVEHKVAMAERSQLEYLKREIAASATDGSTACALQRPAPSGCVFHMRLGEVFTGISPNRTAAQLWHGRNAAGDAYREKFGERYIQTRAYFERALRRLPNGTTHAIVVGNENSLLTFASDSPRAKHRKIAAAYMRLFLDWLGQTGLRIERRAGSRLSGYHGADCDYLYMAQSHCFVVSGGSFGRSISQVVQARGGTVLTGAIEGDPFTDDWYHGRQVSGLDA